jgi:hypothetical protein
MKIPQTSRLWLAVLGLGLAAASAAQAQSYGPGQPGYPPMPMVGGWAPPYNPYSGAPRPTVTYMGAPTPPAVNISPPPVPPIMPAAMMGPPVAAQPAAQVAPAAGAPSAPAAELPAEAPCCQPSCSGPCVGPCAKEDADAGFFGTCTMMTAASIGMLGRDDSGNRFNIFNNMAALPVNRIWDGYQLVDHFKSGEIGGDPSLLTPRNLNLYRFGAEIALNSSLSVTIQDQYIDSAGSPDSWGSLQVLFKYAFINDDRCVWSAVVGVAPQEGNSPDELHERTTRFYGGFLFYEAITCNLFLQGGAQVDLATNDLPQTLDFDLSLGYWLYRNPHLDPAGRSIDEMAPQFYSCRRHWIWGIIPQVEILGKYVMANAGGQLYPTFTPSAFQEENNVYDVTLGGRILFTPHISLSGAFSVPVTGPEVRKGEFLTNLNIGF